MFDGPGPSTLPPKKGHHPICVSKQHGFGALVPGLKGHHRQLFFQVLQRTELFWGVEQIPTCFFPTTMKADKKACHENHETLGKLPMLAIIVCVRKHSGEYPIQHSQPSYKKPCLLPRDQIPKLISFLFTVFLGFAVDLPKRRLIAKSQLCSGVQGSEATPEHVCQQAICAAMILGH